MHLCGQNLQSLQQRREHEQPIDQSGDVEDDNDLIKYCKDAIDPMKQKLGMATDV